MIRNTFTKYADPSTLPTGTTTRVAIAPNNEHIAIGMQTSPYLAIYKLSGGVLTKLSNPASMPSAEVRGVAFSHDSTYLTIGGQTFLSKIYKRSGDTFTELAGEPNIAPAATPAYVDFTDDSTYMAIGSTGGPSYLSIYKQTSTDNFDLLTVTAPDVQPTSALRGLSFSPGGGTYLAVSTASSPRLSIYKRSGDTFTKLADPASLPTNQGREVAFSHDSTYLAIATYGSPYIVIYKRSGDTFTKLSDPATTPSNGANGRCFRRLPQRR